jgi:hypothetical protein
MVDAETVVLSWSSASRPVALRGQGIEGDKPLGWRCRGVVPRRGRLRRGARVVVQGARVS